MSVYIGELFVDVATAEDHSFDSEVTEYPVESGADVADHVRPRPQMVSIEGIVTNTPIGSQAQPTLDAQRSSEALAMLLAMRDAREPIRVETALKTYENMLLEALNVTENAETGDALRFRASFKQLQIVTNNRTTLRVKAASGSAKVNLGHKPSKALEINILGVKLKTRENLDYDDPKRWVNPTRTSRSTSGPFRWQ